jgi:hypothetical protein
MTCIDCLESDDECVCGDYVYMPEGWGADVTRLDHEAACARMDAIIDDHAPDGVTITVRAARNGEAPGLYAVHDNGTRTHITHPPTAIYTALGVAWQRTGETFPNSTDHIDA